jgi:L-fucose mutarotase/ribose pyranase (RbsD/FucU family)
LSVLPLDDFVDVPVLRMEVVGKPKKIPAVQADSGRLTIKRPGPLCHGKFPFAAAA